MYNVKRNINPLQQRLRATLKTEATKLLHWPNVAELETQVLETASYTQTLEPQ